MAVKRALDNLSSLLPATITSTPPATMAVSQGIQDLRMLEPIMSTIHATLLDAEQYWNLHEETAKLWLKELKDLAYDAEDVIEEYEYEVNRCRVEAFERSAADLQGGASSSKRRRHEICKIHACEDVLNEHIEDMLHGEDTFLKNMIKHPSKLLQAFCHLTRCSRSILRLVCFISSNIVGPLMEAMTAIPPSGPML
ncbi:unnamed protein product [Urochloa humidicola]